MKVKKQVTAPAMGVKGKADLKSPKPSKYGKGGVTKGSMKKKGKC